MNKTDSLKKQISKLLDKYEKIEKEIDNNCYDQKRFYNSYEENFKDGDKYILDVALFDENWINVIGGEIILTDKGKKVITFIKNKKKEMQNIINKIKKLLKKIPVWLTNKHSNTDLFVEFGRIKILIYKNSVTYGNGEYPLYDVSNGELFELLYKKEFIGDFKEEATNCIGGLLK